MKSAPPPWHILHHLPSGARSILDVGCSAGGVLQHAHELGVKDLYGIEIDPAAVEQARTRHSGKERCEIVHGSADELPFPDGAVDVAVCSEVLEHVPSQIRPKVISEIRRVLKPGGRFIMTVPYDGIFSSLDAANFRFRFPKLFGWVSSALGGAGRDGGYEGQKHGVVWHHHFSMRELRELLESHFVIDRIRWRGGFLAPLCECMEWPFYRRKALEHPLFKSIQRLRSWDLSFELGDRLAHNILLVLSPR